MKSTGVDQLGCVGFGGLSARGSADIPFPEGTLLFAPQRVGRSSDGEFTVCPPLNPTIQMLVAIRR